MSIKQDYFKYLKHFGNTVTLRSYSESPDNTDLIALRHDIDYDIDLALEMAYWEHREGFRSTYFLLHTADYWNDADFIDKALQLQDFGHEVALHNNLVSRWQNHPDKTPESELRDLLADLRKAGIDIVGTSAHGDALCYAKQFINYWIFSDLRPDNPVIAEKGLNAEGIHSTGDRASISYPSDHTLHREDGELLPLWSVPFAEYGLAYDAAHLASDQYFSDSGGGWTRTPDPLSTDLSNGSYQVLIHPEHWRGPKQIFFFLSTARSGSKWLANYLDTATSLHANHEFTLNHRYARGDSAPNPEKRTGHGFVDLLKNTEEQNLLCVESRNWIETLQGDYAEANIYFESILPVLKSVFPESQLVHLHRDPKDVVRSLMNRGWYDVPKDSRHPAINIRGWRRKTQFEKICWYVRQVNESLIEQCDQRIVFEEMVKDPDYLPEFMIGLGIAVYPRLARKCHGSIVNANQKNEFPSFEDWLSRYKYDFLAIIQGLSRTLGYESTYDENASARLFSRANYLKFCGAYYDFKNQIGSKVKQLASVSGKDGISQEIDFSNKRSVPPLFPVRCSCKYMSQGLMFLVDTTSEYNAYCVINGDSWTRIGKGKGWAAKIGTYIDGTLELESSGEGECQLFVLMFDRNGKILDKKSIALIGVTHTEVHFSFRALNEADRFNFALYFPSRKSPQKVLVKKLIVKELTG
ncbi:sulfotransferase [Deltaproteobacteria bacterium]|nr:sulfotransferase [Deltaproteobacteria bacterium]